MLRRLSNSIANWNAANENLNLSPMRILVWGINYAPEVVGIAPCNKALCDYLVSRDHSVDMLTTFSYYPMWKKRSEDQGIAFRTDQIDGVSVHRCWHYVPKRPSTLHRIAHELSFVSLSFLRALCLQKPDVIVAVSPPLLLGGAAWLVSCLRRIPFVFHVQDLQPDAAAGLGMLKESFLLRALFALEAFNYSKAAKVCGISTGMLNAFARKGVPKSKQVLFPNGVNLPSSIPQRGEFRNRHGIAPETFVTVYSGNIGIKQGLDAMVEVARLLPKQQFVICGEGADRDRIAALAEASKLENFLLLPLQDNLDYPRMLVDADICLISQKAGSGASFFPSKLLSATAFSKPVLAVADEESELAKATRSAGFGYVVPPDQPAAIALAIEDAVANPAGLLKKSQRARSFAEGFAWSNVLERFEAVLAEVVAAKSK